MLFYDSLLLIVIIFLAIALDLIMGDPRSFPHPVVLIGKLITVLDKRWNKGKYRVAKGVCLVFTVLTVVAAFTIFVLYVAYLIHPIVAIVVHIYLVSSTIAINGLHVAATKVYRPLVKQDILLARKNLSMIVGRDTDKLSEQEIIRGTVETVAENTVDGITSPLFWAFIGGAPLAMLYRAVNTLDSMVGYKDARYAQFGWAAAKLDDLVNWLPARITALTILFGSVVIKGSNRKNGWIALLRDAKKHPSPNSGFPEAMVAGLLGVQLGGVNYYRTVKSVRATMGDKLRDFTRNDIRKAIMYMHGGWFIFVSFIVILLFMINGVTG